MLEPILEAGGCLVDFHSCELFPERWFELVLVLQCSTESLYDRLTARGYGDKKRAENMECEIMQTVLEEARESYDGNIVHALPSGTLEELESNVERICTWLSNWKENNPDA
jgi:adenylate kinase